MSYPGTRNNHQLIENLPIVELPYLNHEHRSFISLFSYPAGEEECESKHSMHAKE